MTQEKNQKKISEVVRVSFLVMIGFGAYLIGKWALGLWIVLIGLASIYKMVKDQKKTDV